MLTVSSPQRSRLLSISGGRVGPRQNSSSLNSSAGRGPFLLNSRWLALRPQLRRSHVVLQRLRGDCHCRVPEDRVRGSETAAKPPAGGVAAWLPSFSPPQGRSWQVPSHYVHVEQTLQELNATHSASGSNRTVTLAYGNYQN